MTLTFYSRDLENKYGAFLLRFHGNNVKRRTREGRETDRKAVKPDLNINSSADASIKSKGSFRLLFNTKLNDRLLISWFSSKNASEPEESNSPVSALSFLSSSCCRYLNTLKGVPTLHGRECSCIPFTHILMNFQSNWFTKVFTPEFYQCEEHSYPVPVLQRPAGSCKKILRMPVIWKLLKLFHKTDIHHELCCAPGNSRLILCTEAIAERTEELRINCLEINNEKGETLSWMTLLSRVRRSCKRPAWLALTCWLAFRNDGMMPVSSPPFIT